MPTLLLRISAAAFPKDVFCGLIVRGGFSQWLPCMLARPASSREHSRCDSTHSAGGTVRLCRHSLRRYFLALSTPAGAASLPPSAAAKDESDVAPTERGVRMTFLLLRAYALLLSFERNMSRHNFQGIYRRVERRKIQSPRPAASLED